MCQNELGTNLFVIWYTARFSVYLVSGGGEGKKVMRQDLISLKRWHFWTSPKRVLKILCSPFDTVRQWCLQLKSWNYGQFFMSITRHWVNAVIWAVAYQQVIGSLTNIAAYAYPVIFMKLYIFAVFKSEWEFQCYPIFPLCSAKTHSFTLFQAIHQHFIAAGP